MVAHASLPVLLYQLRGGVTELFGDLSNEGRGEDVGV